MKQAAQQVRKPESGRGQSAAARPFFAPVQAKLNVSTPGEKLEQEADHAADAVVHRRGPMARGVAISKRMTPIAQRAAEDAQMASERASDPAWTEHEPASLMRPGVVEDEPLQMKEEETAQTKEDDRVQAMEEEEAVQAKDEEAKEEELQTKEEDAQAKEEETQAQEEETRAQEEEESIQAKDDDAQAQEEEKAVQAREEEDAQRAEEEEELQRAEEEELQTKPAKPLLSAHATRMQTVERQLRASRGRGNPLPEGVRQKMEQGLGADFSGVRIHTDHPAFLMTRMLNAKAFTSGRDIYFSPHRFAPGSASGDHLLAHELAHTLQQAAVPVREEAVAQRVAEEDQVSVRPEALMALRVARSHIGKINSKMLGEDGYRIGWKRLLDIFRTSYGGDVIHPVLIKKIVAEPHDLPHWCGVFAWHALRKAGYPLPNWNASGRMLENTLQRPPGELPQIGDIAYRQKLPWMPDSAPLTHHQALVSGVEAHATATGKNFKQILVRTVDGNTAGTNNLGGQVEESWQPIGNWDAFFDPAGKVQMPETERVTVDRSDVETTVEPAKDDAPQPQAEVAATDVTDLEKDVTPEAEALPGPEADVAVDLDLPPAVEMEAEPAAKVEKVALDGKSDAAAVGFTKAKPSSMALSAPDLGGALDAKTRQEKKETAKETPELKAQTGGAVDPAITAPGEIPVPEDVTLNADQNGPEVGEIKPDPYVEKGKAPSAAGSYTGQQMAKQADGGGFFDWLKKQFTNLLNSIKTEDNSVNTSAGPKQRVALTGKADVGQMARQRVDGTARLREERDRKVADFKGHPGQSNIQLRKVDQGFKPEQAPEPAEPIDALSPDSNVADYAAAEWPADFRDAADAKMSKKLEGGMAKARADAQKAGADRDAEKSAAVAEAERKTAAANTAADDKQRQAVVAGREDVARKQGAAVQEAYDNVATFSTDAAGEQTTKGKAIAADVKQSETDSDNKLKDGEAAADKLKTDAEKEAKVQKAELAKKEKEESFWDKINPKKIISKIIEGIDKLFTAMRKAVKEKIEEYKNKAIKFINDARDRAIKGLEGFRTWAKDKVDTYVKDRYPGLAKALNEKIDAGVDIAVKGVNAAADGAIDAVNKIADGLAAAIDGLLARFQAALKLAVGAIGAVLTGDFVGALKLAFEAGCALAGVNPKPILDFLDRAGQQILGILKKPGPFINNLFKAVGLGIRNFAENFVTHFKSGVISWLTGTLSAVPITLPDKWDINGFFSLVAQILGLTYDNIKARIIKKFPKAAGVFEKIEKGWKFVKMLLNRDYAGLWAEVKAKLASLKDTILGAIRNWTLLNVIKQGVMWLLSMLNPASAIVRLLKMLADLVFWLVENFQRIKAFVLSVYGAITNIAAGIIKPAAKAVEDALARALPIVLSFIASAVGVDDIAGAIQGVLKKIQAPVNKAIDALIDRVVAFAKKIIAKVVGGAKKAGKKAKDAAVSLLRWWTEKRRFRTKDGGDHKIYYKGEGKRADLWINSDPKTFPQFLAEQKTSDNADNKALAIAAEKIYTKGVLASEEKMDQLQAERKAAKARGDTAGEKAAANAVKREVTNFRKQLKLLSTEIAKMTVEDDAAAITHTTYTDGGHKQVTSLPLTFLPGKDSGSSPTDSPPGWPHAQAINDNEGKTIWIRGHLLNDNVHGPGKTKNLVPIPQSVNRTMETQAESDVKTRVKTNKERLYFRATATYWPPEIPATKGFPKKIILVWHKAEKKGTKWKKGSHLGTAQFTSPKPPKDVDQSVPSIATDSPARLEAAINTQTAGAKVTTHFIGYLKQRTPYATANDIRPRLMTAHTKYDKLNPSEKANRGKQIYRTVAAVKAKKVELA